MAVGICAAYNESKQTQEAYNMGAIVTAETLAQQAQHMPEALLREVLDFMGYLRMKHNLPPVADWEEMDGAAFDCLAEEAIREHRAGRTTPL